MASDQRNELKRVLGFWTFTVYGVGDILGAGIYSLVGAVAAVAGTASWISFAVALAVAALTAFSYAELGGRYPRCAGEAYFATVAFGDRRSGRFVASLIGWLVLASGLLSLATVARACGGYVTTIAPSIAVPAVSTILLLVLGGITFWGMELSSRTNIICTAVELSGLLFVITVALIFVLGESTAAPPPEATPETDVRGIFAGAALAFFAFIGFEDMVNVTEEVKEPRRTVPAAILVALAVAGLIYLVVSFLAVRVVPPLELAESKGPLLDVVRRAQPDMSTAWFTLVALFAVSNTGLLNFVMASRLIFGMAREKLLPNGLARLHGRRRTPHVAVLLVLAVAIPLAATETVEILAGATSSLILCVFLMVHVSLLVIKKRRHADTEGFEVPWLIPVLGVTATLGLLLFVPPKSILVALLIVAPGVILIAVHSLRRRKLTR